MIELDTAPKGMTTLNITKMELAMCEVEEGIRHFVDRYNLGDRSINWMSLSRLKSHAINTRSELECFKKTLNARG